MDYLNNFDPFSDDEESLLEQKLREESGGASSENDELPDVFFEDEPVSEESSVESLYSDSEGKTDQESLMEVYSNPVSSINDDSDENILDSITNMLDNLGQETEVVSVSSSSSYDEDEDEDLLGFDLDTVITAAIDRGASDIHITPNDYVIFRILGEVFRIKEFGVIVPLVTRTLQLKIISNELELDFVETYKLDTSYVVQRGRYTGRRLRLAVTKSFDHITMVFRVISDVIPSPSELGITGSLAGWSKLPNGLVMMNGPTGTGKSSTLASIVGEILKTRRQKVMTIEKPVEYVYSNDGLGSVVQKEVGMDSRSFSSALEIMLREDPDIIVVGEVRNKDEVSQMLRAAQTGHLVLSTMHTNSAAETINQFRSLFEGSEQRRILTSLADISRGFANQVLVKTPDGKSRFAVREILDINMEVADLIREGDSRGIKKYQMDNGITMDHMLVKAVIDRKCTIDEARSKSQNPLLFDEIMKSFM